MDNIMINHILLKYYRDDLFNKKLCVYMKIHGSTNITIVTNTWYGELEQTMGKKIQFVMLKSWLKL